MQQLFFGSELAPTQLLIGQTRGISRDDSQFRETSTSVKTQRSGVNRRARIETITTPITAFSARVFEGEDRWSPVRDVLLKDEKVTIICYAGSTYRIISPTKGYIDARAVSDELAIRDCYE
jgi:hypothetical protein